MGRVQDQTQVIDRRSGKCIQYEAKASRLEREHAERAFPRRPQARSKPHHVLNKGRFISRGEYDRTPGGAWAVLGVGSLQCDNDVTQGGYGSTASGQRTCRSETNLARTATGDESKIQRVSAFRVAHFAAFER